MSEYIHGSTDAREVARLEKQARFTVPFILRDFDAAPGQRVLDLATGVGAMAQALLDRYPSIRLVGVDLSLRQLKEAQSHHAAAGYAQANAAHLPFADETFDRVHCSWLLEHVASPLPILREVHRVLRPGGYCHFTEVDNASFRAAPESPELDAALKALNDAQVAGGGDPYVGRQLERLLQEAGFSRVRVRRAPLHGSGEDPTFFQAFVEEFAEIFESLDEALGPEKIAMAKRAADRLRALPTIPGATLDYHSFVGQGFRD